MTSLDAVLRALADEYGVATGYADQAGRWVEVAPAAVLAALGALGADTDDPAAALERCRDARFAELLPPCVVVRADDPAPVAAHLPAGEGLWCWVEFEGSGATVEVVDHGAEGERRLIAGSPRVERSLRLPRHLPLGWHTLHLACGGERTAVPLAVTPSRLPRVTPGRAWGWAAQLYQLRGGASWGLGDYSTLADLARWAGHGGADLVLVNPLHAGGVTDPPEDSPYSPSSRRVPSPLYLRVADLAAYESAPVEVRRQVDALAPEQGEHLDRAATWRAVRRALELLHPYAPAADGPAPDELQDVALFEALSEEHGPDWRDWPEPLRDPHGSAVESARIRLADRVAFWTWVHTVTADQVLAAQRAARVAGMGVGIVHDLAVGVDPGGADAWLLQDVLAPVGWTVGAPPDSFNQQGQDWGLPPWRPTALAQAAYQPWRDVVRGVLALGGGLRVDHVLGLFRLWWVPPGAPAADGTYVSYDSDALVGILALEAARCGALVVAEDLGTVPERAEQVLAERALLGSVVLWFATADDGFLPPQSWRELAMASLSTHDLPTAAGWLEQEHVRVRGALGVLARPVEEEAAQARRQRAALLDLLAAEGLLDPVLRAAIGDDPPPEGVVDDLVRDLHHLLVRAPSRVVLAALSDAVGDRSQPNLPGVADERYPSWRLPLRDGTGRSLTWEEVRDHPGASVLAKILDDGVRHPPGAGGLR